ncbi:hypothetical protein M2132_002318 [Dysgonomonas sp. PH5-45]|uniref:hypothetical protein n=1 Tax=unclassified Dysgonomonas TaxID=2630389 RepID=UPI002474D56F|nr:MULTISPECIES: hypothetical protein [unclassified Dysgonomonas]MDH6355967.1 hypothetical protein [Dysgonomonas sp. PH5-45]MDH6388862.1 hypothetical protein [Dysgonomonas sp. PH5-37]
MRKILLIQFIVMCLIGCSSNPNNTDLVNKVSKLEEENQQLKETIKLLEYPASNRLISINKLISENKFNEANTEINELQKLFPKSIESGEANNLKQIILDKQAKAKEEEDRIKALGFKALKEEPNIQVGYNKISVGAFSTATTFTYDAYDSRYFYNTADRGNKYVSARITITSTSKDPLLPVFYAYSISGDKLVLIDSFNLRFARWEDYGSYLGNYHDNGNDFAKTSTIPFKIGIEVSEELLQNPVVILVKNENCLKRKYNRFDDPSVSYSSDNCSSHKTLSIEDLKEKYFVVKILNKNKI